MPTLSATEQSRAPEAHHPASEPLEPPRVLLAIFPWASSLLIHLGVALLAIFAVYTTQVQRVTDPDDVVVHTGNLIFNASPGAPLTMEKGAGNQASLRNDQPTRRHGPLVSGGLEGTQAGAAGVGAGAGPGAISAKVSTQTKLIGVGGGVGGGGAAPGKANPFGSPVGAGDGPSTSVFLGVPGTNATKIAFVIDASGSLIDSLPFVIMELKRSIHALDEKQSFTVVFFHAGGIAETPPAGLKKANPVNKQAAIAWIDPRAGHVTPQGQSNPLPAIQKALSYNPQLMFILSDNITGEGRWEMNQQTLLAEIAKANPNTRTKINTIQFLYDDPLAKVPGMKRTMETISASTGGIFKFVDAKQLGID